MLLWRYFILTGLENYDIMSENLSFCLMSVWFYMILVIFILVLALNDAIIVNLSVRGDKYLNTMSQKTKENLVKINKNADIRSM